MNTVNPLDASLAGNALFELVYRELHRIARGQRRAAGSPVTLDTTALVHEAYLKLHDAAESKSYDRVHFLSLAARAMRQILIDHARARSSVKRGGPYSITGLAEEIGVATGVADIVELDAALTSLARFDPRAGQLVEWHVFGGLGIAEIAQLQGVTQRTAFRDWRRARAFLADRLGHEAART